MRAKKRIKGVESAPVQTVFKTEELQFLNQPTINRGPKGRGVGLGNWRYIYTIVVTSDGRVRGMYLHTDGLWHTQAGTSGGYFFPPRTAKDALRIVEASMRRHPGFTADAEGVDAFRHLMPKDDH